MKKYDVVVVGGGFAGVASAIASAREGSKVLLVEKGNCLGGAAVNCLVNPFMSTATRIEGKEVDLSSGIFQEILKRLRMKNAMEILRFLEEELKFILNEMVLEAGVELLFHSYLFAVKKDGDKIKSLSFATRSGVTEVCADYFIDATGDAQMAFLADCPYVLGRESDNLCQPMTLCFRLGNVDVEEFYASKDELMAKHKKALEAGEFKNLRENILVFRYPAKGVLHFNTTRIIKHDPTNPEDVTNAEILAREQVKEIYDFMKKNAKGLEDSYLMMTASEIGVRESRMIVGD